MSDRGWPFACVLCGSRIDVGGTPLTCEGCGTTYDTSDGIPLLVAASTGGQAERQAAFFDEEVDEEFELRRPTGAPALYEWLLREKFRRSVGAVELEGRTALTVCGGSGMDAEFLARSGARVICSDISLGAVRRARERGRRHGITIDVVVADASQLPFPDKSIDVVYVHDGLHHLADPLVGLVEMARVAREVVCVTEPARAAVTALAVRAGLALEHEDAGNRVARLSPDEVRATLTARGFEVTESYRYGMYYRHEPGRAVRALSREPLLSLATFVFGCANALVGRFGNKLVARGVREAA
jgi:SAM-dependent methyltransferase